MCTQKNSEGQIIEGILDSDTVEALLHETNLTLTKTVSSKCQAQEAAKKQRASLANKQLEAIITF